MRAKTAKGEPAAAGDRRSPTTVAIVAYDGLSMFEFGVATEVFGVDRTELFGVPWYQFRICALAAVVTTAHGLQLGVPNRLGALRRADIVIVPPTERLERVPPEVLGAIRAAHARGSRVVSLCTGAFIVAEAGLLEGRRATTHWAHCALLAARHPGVMVDPGVLYIDDGDVLTSAGSAASIDLCLHLVRQDYGAEIAAALARRMVVPPHRDGGQAQYIDMPISAGWESDLFDETLAWLQEHLDEEVSVSDLAARAAMSRRTFARRFLATTGTTPYQWLIRQRLQLAQRLLETTDRSVEVVAQQSGFVTATNLRKHFGRIVTVSPLAYRATFRSPEVRDSTVSF
jgi:AraC family transcriptional regulator, transcriptional activator FtrA